MFLEFTQEKFKNFFILIKGLNITKSNLTEDGVPCVNYGQIHSKYGFEVDPKKHHLPFVPHDYMVTNPKSLMKFGDFVFADTSEDIAGSGNFTYLNSSTPAFAGYHTIIARPKKQLNYRYLAYFFDSPAFRSQIQSEVNGVKVYSITRSILKNTTVCIPSCEEQEFVVRYLDWKVSRINKLINAKRRQIALLTEQKQTFINTELNGIESDSVLCRYLGTFQNGISEAGDFFTDGFPFVNYSDVYNNAELPKTVDGKAKSNEKQQGAYSVEEGDVFFTRTSETIDEVGLTSVCFKTIEQAVFSGFVIRMRPKKGLLDNTYAKYYFRSQFVRDYFIKEMNLVTRASLGQTLLKNLPVLMPSLDVQRSVGEKLDVLCEKVDHLTVAAQNVINLLHEYRTRLISDVVTGKLDVRGAAVPEYEAVEDTVADTTDEEDEIGGI